MKTLPPFSSIVFGAFGHLAGKSIYPSLFKLAELGRLNEDFQLVGFGRTKKNTDEFQEYVQKSIKQIYPKAKEATIEKFLSKCSYICGEYDRPEGFFTLDKNLENSPTCTKKKIYYFAVPSSTYKSIISNLGSSMKSTNCAELLFEKPFGLSEADARDLYFYILRYFTESQVYIIDHYLAKSGVMNILFLREANRLLSHVLRGKEIAHIEIESFEKSGIGERGGYFDAVGLIKDMIQSHLMSIFALATMNVPIEKSAKSIQREKISILNALRVMEDVSLKTGQYKSYLNEKDVPKTSTIETFASFRLHLDLEEWCDTDILITAGKNMKEDVSRIIFTLKSLPFEKQSNRVIFEIKPEPKLILQIVAKSIHGEKFETRDLFIETPVACYEDDCLPEHTKIFEHLLMNNHLYFVNIHEAFASWKIIDEVMTHVKKPFIYKDGSTLKEIYNKHGR